MTHEYTAGYGVISHRKQIFITVCIICLFVTVQAIQAADTEIDGLLIDNTQTRIGHEFYRNFSLFWQPPQKDGVEDYTIVIAERASAQWGSWIWISVNEKRVYQKVLQPRSAEIEQASAEAAAAVRRYLLTEFLYQNKLLDEDLGASGI